MKIGKFEMATIKRTAQNVKKYRTKKAKIEDKIKELQLELETINKTIDMFEAPIKEMTGGFTSEEVLTGAMEVLESVETSVEDTVSNEEVPEVMINNPSEEVSSDCSCAEY